MISESMMMGVFASRGGGEELKKKLMEEGHNTPYLIHPGGDKLYKDLKRCIGGLR